MLSIKNLHVSVKNNKILEGLDIDIQNGELHVVMGPNGSGKSTLANVISGKENYKVDKGKISYLNENLLDMEVEERASKGIFMSFQYPIEIPGINNAYFLRSAINSQQKFNNEIEKEVAVVEKEIADLKKSSLSSISKIAEETSVEIVKQIVNTEVNKSNVSAIVGEIVKGKIDKHI